MSKRILSLLLCLTVLTSLMCTSVQGWFADVSSGSWYCDAVDYAYDRGLFKGVDEHNFSPNVTMSRSMFVTVLYRMCREVSTDYPATGFPDVPQGDWFTDAANWGVANGLIHGTDQGTFCPEDPITREQICKLVCLYCSYIGFTLPVNTAIPTFPDSDTVSEYAREYVDLCLGAGLINGCGDGTLNPGGQATRAEVATILQRLGLLMENAGYVIGPGNPSEDWRMILVNRWNPMPEGYADALELTYISSTERIDSRIYADYSAMVAAMTADGLSPYINSGFRTRSIQEYLYANQINKFLSYGYSRADAEILAQQWVAVPGTSEHEVGLAIDFNMYMSNSDAVHSWLQTYGPEYGFIYRYQPDKTEATGINPEAWHFRYVGRDNAIRITESGLCLEEYLERFS